MTSRCKERKTKRYNALFFNKQPYDIWRKEYIYIYVYVCLCVPIRKWKQIQITFFGGNKFHFEKEEWFSSQFIIYLGIYVSLPFNLKSWPTGISIQKSKRRKNKIKENWSINCYVLWESLTTKPHLVIIINTKSFECNGWSIRSLKCMHIQPIHPIKYHGFHL